MDGHIQKPFNRAVSPPVFNVQEENLPLILKLEEVAAYFNRKPNTIYEWKAKGLLDEACRKRGKHLFFWRDKLIEFQINNRED